jgi:hypothetical protein
MNHHMFRLGRLAGLSAFVAAVLATVSLVDASAAVVKPDSCPTNKPLVVNSYFTAENSADYGADGHVWALDAGTRFIQISRLGGDASLGGDAYCLQIHDVGTFTTFAGLSPEGTGTVGGGVTGSFDGTSYLRVYGKFAPTVPTTGPLGNFDAQCQQDGTCAEPILSIRRSYFPSGYQHVDPGAFAITYDGGACGRWFQSNSGDTGDIVC